MSSRLSSLLVQDGLVTAKRVAEALQRQVISGGTIDSNLLELKAVDDDTLLTYLGRACGLPTQPTGIGAAGQPKPEVLEVFTQAVAERFHAVPTQLLPGGVLQVLVTDDVEMSELDALALQVKQRIEPWVVLEFRFAEAMDKVYGTGMPKRYTRLLDRSVQAHEAKGWPAPRLIDPIPRFGSPSNLRLVPEPIKIAAPVVEPPPVAPVTAAVEPVQQPQPVAPSAPAVVELQPEPIRVAAEPPAVVAPVPEVAPAPVPTPIEPEPAQPVVQAVAAPEPAVVTPPVETPVQAIAAPTPVQAVAAPTPVETPVQAVAAPLPTQPEPAPTAVAQPEPAQPPIEPTPVAVEPTPVAVEPAAARPTEPVPEVTTEPIRSDSAKHPVPALLPTIIVDPSTFGFEKRPAAAVSSQTASNQAPQSEPASKLPAETDRPSKSGASTPALDELSMDDWMSMEDWLSVANKLPTAEGASSSRSPAPAQRSPVPAPAGVTPTGKMYPQAPLPSPAQADATLRAPEAAAPQAPVVAETSTVVAAAAQPVAAKPEAQPVAEKPDAQPIAEKPATQPVAEKPDVQPVAEKPAQAAAPVPAPAPEPARPSTASPGEQGGKRRNKRNKGGAAATPPVQTKPATPPAAQVAAKPQPAPVAAPAPVAEAAKPAPVSAPVAPQPTTAPPAAAQQAVAQPQPAAKPPVQQQPQQQAKPAQQPAKPAQQPAKPAQQQQQQQQTKPAQQPQQAAKPAQQPAQQQAKPSQPAVAQKPPVSQPPVAKPEPVFTAPTPAPVQPAIATASPPRTELTEPPPAAPRPIEKPVRPVEPAQVAASAPTPIPVAARVSKSGTTPLPRTPAPEPIPEPIDSGRLGERIVASQPPQPAPKPAAEPPAVSTLLLDPESILLLPRVATALDEKGASALSPEAARDLVEVAADYDALYDALCRGARGRVAFAAIFNVHGASGDVALGRTALADGWLDRAQLSRISVPLDRPSAFRTATHERAAVQASLGDDPTTNDALRALGRPVPVQAAVFPIAVRGKTTVLLYLDDGGTELPAELAEDLGGLLADAAGALQRLTQGKTGGLGAAPERTDGVVGVGVAESGTSAWRAPDRGRKPSGTTPTPQVSAAPATPAAPPAPATPAAAAAPVAAKPPVEARPAAAAPAHAAVAAPAAAPAPAVPATAAPAAAQPSGKTPEKAPDKPTEKPVEKTVEKPSAVPTVATEQPTTRLRVDKGKKGKQGREPAPAAPPVAAAPAAVKEPQAVPIVAAPLAVQPTAPLVAAKSAQSPKGAAKPALSELVTRAGNQDDQAAAELLAGGAEAARAVVAALPGPLRSGDRLTSTEAAAVATRGPLLALAVRMGASAVTPLLDRLKDAATPAKTRYFLVLLLGELPVTAAVLPLGERLFDEDEEVRAAAAASLRGFPASKTLTTLFDKLRSDVDDSDARHASQAVEALGELRDAHVVPRLIELLDHEDPSLADAAGRALRTLTKQDFGRSRWRWGGWWRRQKGQPRLQWLLAGLGHSSALVRSSAQDELLGLSGDVAGYRFDQPRKERDQAARQWAEWWQRRGYGVM